MVAGCEVPSLSEISFMCFERLSTCSEVVETNFLKNSFIRSSMVALKTSTSSRSWRLRYPRKSLRFLTLLVSYGSMYFLARVGFAIRFSTGVEIYAVLVIPHLLKSFYSKRITFFLSKLILASS